MVPTGIETIGTGLKAPFPSCTVASGFPFMNFRVDRMMFRASLFEGGLALTHQLPHGYDEDLGLSQRLEDRP